MGLGKERKGPGENKVSNRVARSRREWDSQGDTHMLRYFLEGIGILFCGFRGDP